MTFIPPPYEEVSPDGRRYFKLLGVSPNLIGMYDLLLQASELAAIRPDPSGRVQSAQIDMLILKIKREVEEAAKVTAVEADRIIRSLIDQTRVRPPTLGVKNTNTSLAGGIHSRPVASVLPGGGAVGIADIEELIHATLNPSVRSQVPYYWRAQEFGSRHVVQRADEGKFLYGVFQPGGVGPSPSSARSHPIFEVRGPSASVELAGGGGVLQRGQSRFRMIVRNPIEARGFLRNGAYEAYNFRTRLHRTTEGAAIAQMSRIGATAAVP